MSAPVLLQQFQRYLDRIEPVFKDARTKARMREMAVSSIVADSPKTLTSLIEFNRKHGDPNLPHGDWSSSYRAMSMGKWNMQDVSRLLLGMAVEFVADDEPIMILVDDTLLRKTGRRIPNCAYARYPLSPPFQVNLTWGQRVLCVSMLARSSATSAYRSIPIFFQLTPTVKIPSKASPAERETLMEVRKKNKMSVVGRALVDEIRLLLDTMGLKNKKLVVCGDGSFANRAFMAEPPHDTAFVCRCRNDLRLFRPLSEIEKKGKRLYGERLQTPAEFATDARRPLNSLECGVLHQHATVSYKSMGNIRWPTVLKNQPCSVCVIKGQHYRKYGKRHYTEPAFLVITGDVAFLKDNAFDRNAVSLTTLIEAYLLRWEIEVGFRDQKNGLGIGKAQVWHEQSVRRTPAFMSACYAMLLMSSMKVFDDKRTEDFRKLPKWRRIAPQRPSIRDLVELLRREIPDTGCDAA